MTLHNQLPIKLSVMETARQKGGMATKASLRQDGATPGLSGMFHLQEDAASPVLSLARCQGAGGCPPHP